MATDARRRQKKIQRRKVKRKKTLAKRRPLTLADRLKRVTTAPILHCLAMDSLQDSGITNVLLSRGLPSGHVAFASRFFNEVF